MWVWIENTVVDVIHDVQLAEHGGISGIRDAGLLASALAKPQNLLAYGEPDLAALAAAYGYGISRNNPFLDGNKRTAFVVVELFLSINGFDLFANDSECVLTMLAVAAGDLSEDAFAAWLRSHIKPR